MTALRGAVCGVLLWSGCQDEHLAQLDRVKAEVCACTTPACAEAAMTKIPKANIESTARSQQVASAMLDCLGKLYQRGRPSTDPDAPISGSAGSTNGNAGSASSANGNAGSASAGGSGVTPP
ncbi:MAG: hypothetical protein AB7P03_20110 [Kofleriaceae bacterium]